MRNKLAILVVSGLLTFIQTPAFAHADTAIAERVSSSASVLLELTKAEDGAIPHEMLQRAEAIAVIPGVIKGALGIGGRYGKGLVSERLPDGRWSAPVFIQIGGGSWGPQIGVTSTDLVLVFNDADALRKLEDGTDLKLGADASIVAGPVGRSAEVGANVGLDSAVLAYSRSKGLFAGVALDGAVLDVDEAANLAAYEKPITAKEIWLGEQIHANETVRPFIDALQQVTPVRKVTQK